MIADFEERLIVSMRPPSKKAFEKAFEENFYQNIEFNGNNYLVMIYCPPDNCIVDTSLIGKFITEIVAKGETNANLLESFKNYVTSSKFKLDDLNLNVQILVKPEDSEDISKIIDKLEDYAEVEAEKNEDKYNFKAPLKFEFIKGGMFSNQGIYTVSLIECSAKKAIYFEVSRRTDSIKETIETDDYTIYIDDNEMYKYTIITDATPPPETSILDLINNPDHYSFNETSENYFYHIFFKGKNLISNQETFITQLTKIISKSKDQMFAGFKSLVEGSFFKSGAFNLSPDYDVNIQILVLLPNGFPELESDPTLESDVNYSIMDTLISSVWPSDNAAENITGLDVVAKQEDIASSQISLIGGKMTSNDTFCAAYRLDSNEYGLKANRSYYFKVARLPKQAHINHDNVEIDMPSGDQVKDIINDLTNVLESVSVGNKNYRIVTKGSGINKSGVLPGLFGVFGSYTIKDIETAVLEAVGKDDKEMIEDLVSFINGHKSRTRLKPFDLNDPDLDFTILVVENSSSSDDVIERGDVNSDMGIYKLFYIPGDVDDSTADEVRSDNNISYHDIGAQSVTGDHRVDVNADVHSDTDNVHIDTDKLDNSGNTDGHLAESSPPSILNILNPALGVPDTKTSKKKKKKKKTSADEHNILNSKELNDRKKTENPEPKNVDISGIKYIGAEVHSRNVAYFSILSFDYVGQKHFFFEMGVFEGSEHLKKPQSHSLRTDKLCPKNTDVDSLKANCNSTKVDIETENDKYEVYFTGTGVNYGYTYNEVAKSMVDVIKSNNVFEDLKTYIDSNDLAHAFRTPFHLTKPDIKVLIVKTR